MLQTAQHKQRGWFTGARLSGTAKRAAELFDRNGIPAAEESVPRGIADQRSDREVEAQLELVCVAADKVHKLPCTRQINMHAICHKGSRIP